MKHHHQELHCPQCGITKVSYRKNQKFCSNTCRMNYHAEIRQKALAAYKEKENADNL